MTKFVFLFFLLLGTKFASAQRVVFDPRHFATINENGAFRLAAESAHNNYLEKIDGNLQNINLNTGSVVLAQTMIYNGLSNVNSALKNGLAFKNLAVIVADILSYSRQMADMAKSEPYLLLFAEEMGTEMRSRSVRLVADVSAVILKEGNNMLADYNSRDELLRSVTQELQIISSLAYGGWRAMYWAKQRGIIKAINPYANYINTDKAFVEDILRNTKYLKQ